MSKFLLYLSFVIILSTGFIVNNSLADGVVSGKYFWFYGSMGILSFVTVVYSLTNRQLLRFTLFDLMILLFIGSVFFSATVFNNSSANSTKLIILVLLFSVCWFLLLPVYIT